MLEHKIYGFAVEEDLKDESGNIVWTKGDSRNKKEYQEWKKAQTDPILSDEVWDKCVNIDTQIGDDIRELLKDGYSEVSILWTDSYGRKFKARIDRITRLNFWDLKTTAMQIERPFREHCVYQLKNRFTQIQLVLYAYAAKFFKTLPVIMGTQAQKDFIKDLPNSPQPAILYTRTDAPQYQPLIFTAENAPEYWQISVNQTQNLIEKYTKAQKQFGDKPWIEPCDTNIILTDEDFYREVVKSYEQ